MQSFKEFTAKTAEEAIEAGLTELGLTRETAQIRILEEGKKKLFGTVKARVEIAPLNEQEEEIDANTCEEKEEIEEIGQNGENTADSAE